MTWRRWDLAKLSGELLPVDTETYNIGSLAKRWLTLFVMTIVATTVTVSGQLNVEGNLNVTGTINITGNFSLDSGEQLLGAIGDCDNPSYSFGTHESDGLCHSTGNIVYLAVDGQEMLGATSGQVATILDGSASSPSLYIGSDPNTGMWQPSEDRYCVTAGGVNQFCVADNHPVTAYGQMNATGYLVNGTAFERLWELSSNGNDITLVDQSDTVGLGGASTGSRLFLVENSADGALRIQRDSNTVGQTSTVFFGFNDSNGNRELYAAITSEIEDNSANLELGNLGFWTTQSGELFETMHIDGSGNVGIGTTSPDRKFQVVDTDTKISLFDGRFVLNGSTTQAVNMIFEGNSAGLIWQDDNGDVDKKKVQALINDELFRLRGLSDTNALTHAGINFDLDNGFIGINTTAPEAMLDIEGDAKFTYTGSGAWLDASSIVGTGVSNFNYRPTLNGTGNQQTMTLVPTFDPQGSGQTVYSINTNVRVGGSTSNPINNIYSLFTQAQLLEDYDGVISNLYGLRVNGLASETSSGSPNVTNQWGVHVNNPTIAGQSLTVGYSSGVTAGDGKYGLYLSGDAVNWLEGDTGIGTNTPDTTLEVDGGVEISELAGTWSNGEAYVCVFDNGTIFAKDSACS